jgi:dolichol-phosphate mannosyltransferase
MTIHRADLSQRPAGAVTCGNRTAPNKVVARFSDTIICAPTYNEVDSIGLLLEALLALPLKFDILIIDDGSSDGTQSVIEAWAAQTSRICLIERNAKLGIGSAHRLAWAHARQLGYARIVTLDADLSHDPADIPRLLAALDAGADVAIGSRFAPGGRIDYKGWRLLLSWTANYLARKLLGLTVREYTTSLRAAHLDAVPVDLVENNVDGYSFFLTCIVKFTRAGLTLTEVPIHFRDRHAGHSKLPKTEILRAALTLIRFALERGR